MKVLVVDNSPVARDEIIKSISSCCQVETADNGAAALDKYLKFTPNIVILSLELPIMDGYETLSKLLELDKDAQVVMISAAEDHEVLRKFFAKGAIGYIVKPFAPNQLVDTIKNVLKNKNESKVVFIFSRLMREIQNLFDSIGGIHVTVSLLDVDVMHVDHTQSTRILEVHEIKNVNIAIPEKPPIPQNTTGLVTEILNKQSKAGMIITWHNEDALNKIRDKYAKEADKSADRTLESFNILHKKLLTEIINSTGIHLQSDRARPYDHDKDSWIHNKVDLTRAKYEISYEEIKIFSEIHLYFDIHALFRNFF